MSSHPVTLDIPDELYDRAQQLARVGERRIEDILMSELRLALQIPEPQLEPDEEAELAALRSLSDDALWTIARERLPADIEARLQALLEVHDTHASAEQPEVEALLERADRLMVRRAEAAALLTRRGYTVTPDLLSE